MINVISLIDVGDLRFLLRATLARAHFRFFIACQDFLGLCQAIDRPRSVS